MDSLARLRPLLFVLLSGLFYQKINLQTLT